MGKFMQDDDILIESFFELLNLRFAPPLSEAPNPIDTENGIDNLAYGGVQEIAALQREFQIFRAGRSFRDSVAVLNLGGLWNSRARNRWYALLADLKSYGSNKDALNGDEAIVNALIINLAEKKPYPVYFESHDSTKENRRIVFVDEDPKRHPIFYIRPPDPRYLIISIPMRPR
jgi:hypothetical protein